MTVPKEKISLPLNVIMTCQIPSSPIIHIQRSGASSSISASICIYISMNFMSLRLHHKPVAAFARHGYCAALVDQCWYCFSNCARRTFAIPLHRARSLCWRRISSASSSGSAELLDAILQRKPIMIRHTRTPMTAPTVLRYQSKGTVIFRQLVL